MKTRFTLVLLAAALTAATAQAQQMPDLNQPVFIKTGAIVCNEQDHMVVLLNQMRSIYGLDVPAAMKTYGCVHAAPNLRVAVVLEQRDNRTRPWIDRGYFSGRIASRLRTSTTSGSIFQTSQMQLPSLPHPTTTPQRTT